MRKVSTKYPGVRYREHPNRKHGVQPDRYFFIRYQKDGRRVEEGLGWASEGMTAQKAALELARLKEAARKGEGPQLLREKRELAEQERSEAEARKAEEELNRLTFRDFFEGTYLPRAKTNKVKGSWQAEEGLFQNWIADVLGEMPLCQVSPMDIERIKKRMKDAGRSSRTIDYALATVRQTINLAIDLGMFTGINPVSKVRVKRSDNRRQRYLTMKEAKLLLDGLRKRSEQLHDMALLSLHCGLRAGEIFSLQWSDVDFERQQLLVRDPKSGKNRYAYLTSTALQMLEQRASETESRLWVFVDSRGERIQSVSNTFERVVKKLGLNNGVTDRRQRVVFHSLRHTYASWLVENGTDLYVVSKLLGHSDIKMTQRYSHLGRNALQASVDRLEKTLSMSVQPLDEKGRSANE